MAHDDSGNMSDASSSSDDSDGDCNVTRSVLERIARPCPTDSVALDLPPGYHPGPGPATPPPPGPAPRTRIHTYEIVGQAAPRGPAQHPVRLHRR